MGGGQVPSFAFGLHMSLTVAVAEDLVSHWAVALIQSCEQHVKFVSVFTPH